MDIKTILKSPEDAIKSHWGSLNNCDHIDNILKITEDINVTNSAIKLLKEDKNRCASLFKGNKENADLINQLKQEMSSLSSQLAAAEKKRKALNKSLLSQFETPGADEDETLPQQFLPKPATATAQQKNIIVKLIDDDNAGSWDNYVNHHPNSSYYHLYGWRNLISKSFCHPSFYIAALDDKENIVGVLPIIRLKSRLFGDFAISMPFFNYGGVLADSPDIAKSILEYAANLCKEHGITHLEIRATEKLNDWPTRSEKVSMIRKLPPCPQQLDEELGSKIRAQINRGKSENVRTEFGEIELLNDFYKVFSINMRDLGTPVYSKKFFHNILEQWPGHATITVIYLNDQPVSTAFLLGHKEMVEIPWASTLRRANPMSINMLLYWEVLSHAITKGYGYFDFGRSSINSNTYKFKKQWGAKPVTHYWHYWLSNNADLPELNPNNPKFKLLINIWQKLPVALTHLIGPPIVKNLP